MTLVSIESQAVANAIEKRNADIERLLRDLGPGWAVGYRLKQPEFQGPFTGRLEPTNCKLEWETHAVELVDGQLPAGLAGFQYVTLKEQL